VGGVQILATIKNRLKFIQGKEFMRIGIIAEEDLTQKVLAGLKNNFAVSGLGRSLDVLLDKGVDAFATVSTVADLDRVGMVTEMNAGTLSGTTAVDVEDFGMAWSNALGRLLTDPANKSGPQRYRATNGKGLLCEAVEISIIDSGGAMSTLKVVASRIMTLQVANAGRRTKSKAQVIGNVGGLGFGPDMAVEAFVHAVHGLGLRMRGRDAY
jgi:hypothetical protein